MSWQGASPSRVQVRSRSWPSPVRSKEGVYTPISLHDRPVGDPRGPELPRSAARGGLGKLGLGHFEEEGAKTHGPLDAKDAREFCLRFAPSFARRAQPLDPDR